MPRRKLTRFKAKRPSDQSLKQYGLLYSKEFVYLHPEDVTNISSEILFGNQLPLFLDLGCGRGEFTVAQAEQNPEINFVGIDLHLKSIYASINRAEKTTLTNIKFIQLDIMNALKRIQDRSIEEIYLLFPPPVLKEKFLYKDVLTTSFIAEVSRCLVENGRFHFVTDIESYFLEKVELLKNESSLQLVQQKQSVEGGLTRFQILWESYGELSYRVMFEKHAINKTADEPASKDAL